MGRWWGAKSIPRRPRRYPVNPQEAQEWSTGAKKRSPSLQETLPRRPKAQGKLHRPRKGPQEPETGPPESKNRPPVGEYDYQSTPDTKQSMTTVAGGLKAIGYIFI